MKQKIVSYWYGEEDQKNNLINYYKRINSIIDEWEIVLFPTEEEHTLLLKNSPFYKKSFDLKIYAFCSDYYRLWKIYNNGGWYIDSGCTFNTEQINTFIKQMSNYQYCFVLERPYYLWNGFFYIKEKNNKFLLDSLNYMDKIATKKWKNIASGPVIFSKYLFKYFGTNLEKNKNILLLKSSDFDKNNMHNYFFINPHASWWNKINKRNDDPNKVWEHSFKSFKKSKPYWFILTQRFILARPFFYKLLNIKIIKKIYYSLIHKA